MKVYLVFGQKTTVKEEATGLFAEMGKIPYFDFGGNRENVSWDIFSMSVFAHSREKAIRIRSV